jgi:hypothetical protein
VDLQQLSVCTFNSMNAADKLQNWTKPLQEGAEKDAAAMFLHLECFHNCCIKLDISFFKTDGYPLLPHLV